jgi:hypothetical protein
MFQGMTKVTRLRPRIFLSFKANNPKWCSSSTITPYRDWWGYAILIGTPNGWTKS